MPAQVYSVLLIYLFIQMHLFKCNTVIKTPVIPLKTLSIKKNCAHSFTDKCNKYV